MKTTNNHTFAIALIVCLALNSGCASSRNQQAGLSRKSAERVQEAPVELRLTDHYEWVKRLLATETEDQGIQQVAFQPGSRLTYAIPMTPHHMANGRYFLIVDQQAGLVWLQSSGWGGAQQTDGPWKMTHPDAAHLLHSITTPPGTPAPEQG